MLQDLDLPVCAMEATGSVQTDQASGMIPQGCIKFTSLEAGGRGENIRVRAILGKNIQDLVRN